MSAVPRFTVLTNIVSLESSRYVGTSWEFFDDETDAWECYERHIVLGNVPTKRPFHPNDVKHMGVVDAEAAQRELDTRAS